MKISKHRIKQLILESFRKVLKESDEEEDSNKNQNEIYRKLASFISSENDEEFNTGFGLLEQLVTMESHKAETEEAIKEMAEDLFKKIKDTPLLLGDKELEDRVNKLYSELMKIEKRDGQGGDEYYATLGMYNDAEADFHASSPGPDSKAVNLHHRLEKILKLIGLNAPSFTDIYGGDLASQAIDSSTMDDEYDPFLDDIDYEEFDYGNASYVDPKDENSEDDDFLY